VKIIDPAIPLLPLENDLGLGLPIVKTGAFSRVTDHVIPERDPIAVPLNIATISDPEKVVYVSVYLLISSELRCPKGVVIMCSPYV